MNAQVTLDHQTNNLKNTSSIRDNQVAAFLQSMISKGANDLMLPHIH
jgi:hypothetical protein